MDPNMKKGIILTTLKKLSKPISEKDYHQIHSILGYSEKSIYSISDFEEAEWEEGGRYVLGPYCRELREVINELVSSGNVSRNTETGEIQYKNG